jgi:ribonuclease H / adenosylcobalamin/alpha-ribazole phosphatase
MSLTLSSSTDSSITSLYVFFDGGSRGNPGVSGSGFVIYSDPLSQNIVYKGMKFCGKVNTNNFAEYTGLVEALKYITETTTPEIRKNINLFIYGDSFLVINHLNNKWQVKASNLKPLYAECRDLLKNFKSYECQWIPREKNAVADALSKEAQTLG